MKEASLQKAMNQRRKYMRNKFELKNFFLFLILMFITELHAATGFRVVNVTGTCSLIDDKNETKQLAKGVFLPTNSKIIVAKGGQLSLQAESSEIYHLSESSSLEIWREQLVLLQGTLWVQSQNDDKERGIETVNSFIEFKKSEFVLSFDEVSKKSQIFVISGHASIANIFMREKKELLVSGEISFVQKDFQQGMPRRPSLIGQESLSAVFSKFRGIKPGDENFQNILNENEPATEVAVNLTGKTRSIASVSESKIENGIYYIPKNFSAPKREHPLKPRVKRQIASVKTDTSMPITRRGDKPIRIFDFTVGRKYSTWNALLGEDKYQGRPNNNIVPKIQDRSVSSIKQSSENLIPEKDNVTVDKKETEPDFDSMMKELKGVSAQHNEVY